MGGVTAPNSAFHTNASMELYIPFQFWFCRNVGLALPLIALQYHEVKLVLEFSANTACCELSGSAGSTQSLNLSTVAGATGTGSGLALGSTSLFVDYVYQNLMRK